MLLPLALAVLFVLASLVAGHATLALLGARRPTWLAAAVGFAVLTVLAGVAVRLPGRAATAAVLIALALVAGMAAGRRLGARAEPSPVAAERVVGPIVVVLVLAAGMIPFLLEARAGILGEGIYTNDHAAQLYWTDWLKNGLGPEPTAVAWGYPVGPQSLVAVVAEATGASLVDAFNGLLLAIPALTALSALPLLGVLRPVARVATAALAGLPFLGASFLAQSAFKETAMALLVLGFAATLALASEPDDGRRLPLGRRAAAAVGAILALAALFAYSVPGLAWIGLTFAVWLLLLVVSGDERLDWRAIREAVWRRRALVGITVLVVAGVALVGAGRIADFVERIGDVQASAGRLSSPVWPGEAFGIWPEGDFRVVRGDVDGSLVATAFGALVVIAGSLVALRRRSYALLAALGAAAVIYLGARAFASIYVEAKALAVLAPLAIAAGIGGLFASRGGRWAAPLAALGAVATLAAAASTLLALREAPVGPGDRGEELEALAQRIGGERVVFLGVDRFAAYWLRGTLVESPGGYVPREVRARPEKVWQQGRPMDLDTLPARRLDGFRYAITTTAAYQSSPPPNMRELDRTDSYVLWERLDETPRLRVLEERGAPGALLRCGDEQDSGVDAATVLPAPVVGSPGGWSAPSPFEAPGVATQELELAPGRWQLSIQYHSQVGLTVQAGDLEAEVPASLVGMYLTHQGESSFWPVGELEVRSRGSVPVSVSSHEPGSLERAVDAPRRTWLGEVAATRLDPLTRRPRTVALEEACGAYVDHIGRGRALAGPR